MRVTIRRAVGEDSGHLIELLGRQMAEHSLPVSPAMPRAVAQVFERPEVGSFLVAEAGGEVVGVAYVAFLHSMEHGQTIACLEELYVVETERGKGTGSALLRCCLEEFSIGPGRPMELEVDSTHRSVEALYRRHGFTLRTRTRWIHEPSGGNRDGGS